MPEARNNLDGKITVTAFRHTSKTAFFISKNAYFTHKRTVLKIRCPMRTCGFESHPGYNIVFIYCCVI